MQASKTSNPFKLWKEKREAKKKEIAEQAAMEITNDIAENENKIISVLESVDFLHSKLPEYELNQSSNPEHSCGDIEYATKAIVHYLKKNPQGVLIDIRELDTRLLELAYIFKDAVKTGKISTARGALKAIHTGVKDIRSNVPIDLKENAQLYVKTYAKYLDTCINYCGTARETDELRDQCLRNKEALENDEKSYSEFIEDFKQDLDNNAAYAEAFYKLTENDNTDRASWTEVERTVHRRMVDSRVEGLILEFRKVTLTQGETRLALANARLETLSVKVLNIPIVVDPNQMNKYQEEIDDLFTEFARVDVEIDESLRAVDDIEGRIHQLDSAPGVVRAREVAAEEARKVLEDLKKQQEDELNSKKDLTDWHRKLGIRSEEEQARLKAEIEARQAAEIEAMMNETADESNSLYN